MARGATPRVFFWTHYPNDNPTREEAPIWTRPARQHIGHGMHNHTPWGARPRGISGGGMTDELKRDLALIVALGLLFWLLTRGMPW